jgi:type VI protein secretion system component VasK
MYRTRISDRLSILGSALTIVAVIGLDVLLLVFSPSVRHLEKAKLHFYTTPIGIASAILIGVILLGYLAVAGWVALSDRRRRRFAKH